MLMPKDQAARTRYAGTVAIWYSSHYAHDPRDWRNIEEFGGVYHPLLGYYDCADREIVRAHLRWMRRAGVDAIVYDPFSKASGSIRNCAEDPLLRLLLEELRDQSAETRKLQLIYWLERYASNPDLDEYLLGLDFVRRELAPLPFYFRYRDQPLVVVFVNGGVGECDALEEVIWRTRDLDVRPIRPFNLGADAWRYVDSFPQRLNREWMSVAPGYDSYMEDAYVAVHYRKEPHPDLDAVRRQAPRADREDGAYFERQLLRARYAAPDIVFISGWNDWQYANQIEPAREYGFRYVDLAADLMGRAAETAAYRDQ
jgi:hypothetical protein